MTKASDGTTRVITQPAIASKMPDGSTPKSTGSGHQKDPQKVQIIRGPDGQLTVRGLFAGQQLIQMPDGKLHIIMAGQQSPAGQLVATKSTESIKTEPSPQVVVQGNRQLLVQPAAQPVVVQAGPRPAPPSRLQTVLVQGQILQRQIVQSPVRASTPAVAPAPRPATPSAPSPAPSPRTQVASVRPRTSSQQIMINNPVLAQQLAAGKIQLATVNGQQVLIRPTGNNQAQIVAHIGAVPSTPRAAAPAPPPVLPPAPAPPPLVSPPSPTLTEDQLMERRLLAGQPPGTVIKTVTAQVTTCFNFSLTLFNRMRYTR